MLFIVMDNGKSVAFFFQTEQIVLGDSINQSQAGVLIVAIADRFDVRIPFETLYLIYFCCCCTNFNFSFYLMILML